MDMVLGISTAPTMVRSVLIEGHDANGVTVEEDHFAVAPREYSATTGVDRIIGTIAAAREGAIAGGHRLTATGVTWTDPVDVDALRDAAASHDAGSVMLVPPLLAAAALARAVGDALNYEHIAMLYVERDGATLAIVEAADGSIGDLRRQPLAGNSEAAIAAELGTMVAGLDAPASPADCVFVVGGGVDVLTLKGALEAATALQVVVPEEPDMALARGAALASANAPLFASSTAALAYSLDPGTGDGAFAHSAREDFAFDDDVSINRRGPLVLAGSALAAVAAGLVVISLASDVGPARQPTPAAGAVAQASPMPPDAQLAAPGPPPPAPVPAAPAEPAPEAAAVPAAPPPSPEAAPPAPEVTAAPEVPPAPPVLRQTPPSAVNAAPPAPPPRRTPTRRAPQSVPAPVQQAPAPPPSAAPAPQPVAVPPPPPAEQRP
ncbi:MAG: hypothetical protein JO059_16015, partial [Mycobacterium sp.]|nr:hypothetical protein [Mycobacterium sp.]